jgi:major membrane immunogen (membrane-anchored lipoprotein)
MKKILVIIAVFVMFLFSCEKKDHDLNVDIKSNNFRVEITNQDNFDYENATLELNGEYKIKGVTIKSNETYKAYWSDFTDEDYNKFNPSTMSRGKFTIYCDVSDGSKGFFYGEN